MIKYHFNVVRGRFHLQDRNIYVLQGWFAKDNPEDYEVQVYLDDERLTTRLEKYRDLEVRQRYLPFQAEINEESYIYVTLPSNYRAYKKMYIYTVHGDERTLSLDIPVKRLREAQREVDYCVDSVEFNEEKCIIKGWAVARGGVDIRVLDEEEDVLDVALSRTRRRDVLTTFREEELDLDAGFRIEILDRNQPKVILRLRGNGLKSDTVIDLKKEREAKPETLTARKSRLLMKGIRYYRQHGLRQFLHRVKEKVTGRGAQAQDYDKWLTMHLRSQEELEVQRRTVLKAQPKFSLVVPLYKTPKRYLLEMVESVEKQTYTNWELCLSDGSGKDSDLHDLLMEYSRKDPRIRYQGSETPLGISENTNAAIIMAQGDYIVLLDHDDLLTEDALFENASALAGDGHIDVLYSDEDKVTMDGKKFFSPHFKSDFNIDLLRSMNYISHLFVVKRELLDIVGKIRPEYDGAQDYDFILRCVEKADRVHHIPRILYHWRSHTESTSEDPESKLYAFEAGRKAIEDHYVRTGISAKVSHGPFYGLYKSDYILTEEPLISIVIPNKDHIEDLDKCIRAIEEKSTYRNYEFVIVENNSTEDDTFEYYENLQKENPRARVVTYDGNFNYSLINNFGVGHARGEYLLLLNNDTEMINPDCLKEMLGYCMREDVGIVGARLYYEDDTIQHAGVVMGFGGIAGHAFIGQSKYDNGYFSRIICAQDLSAVTAACMMTKRSVFDQVDGLSPELRVAFNDIDYCMKVRKLGKLVVYNPYAELYHYESKSRGLEDTPEKVKRFNSEIRTFYDKWKDILIAGDPYYNRNLTLDKADFSLKPMEIIR